MKCKNLKCENEVPEKIERRGFVYCQRSCAPFGNLGHSNDISSEPTRVSFYTKAAGIHSQNSEKGLDSHSGPQQRSPNPEQKNNEFTRPKLLSAGGCKSVNTTVSTELGSTKPQRSVGHLGLMSREDLTQEETGPQRSGTWNTTERSGMIGMQETQASTVEKKSNEETNATPASGSENLPESLSQARLLTMNTIDESATLLLSCMKSAAKRGSDHEAPRDYRDLNAIANMGKQIAQLAKVKLDIIKEAKK